MASLNEKVTEFINVTGTTEERAQFFLQAANGELHSALETFFSSHEQEFEDDEFIHPSNNDEDTELPINIEQVESASAGGGSDKKKISSKSKFATISSLNKSDDSDEEQGQAFYAGGSERSGQQILGPSRDKNPTQDLFDAAKRHGAEVVGEIGSSKTKSQSRIFKGAGFKLGSNVEPSEQVNPNFKAQEKQEQPGKDVSIKFWKNGFSVDDGALREFHDPSNKEFMDSIARGEVPIELRRQVMNGEIHVNMEDHREEDYVKPKEKIKAFSGAGHMLGSPSPSVSSSQNVISNSTSSAANTLNPTFQVDNNKPVTTIQIRFSDGTRLLSKFNHDNTIGDIRSLVCKARPNNNSFKLMTTFPNKLLEDDDLTIVEAKLLNAVIVQRLV